jgi:hypothetical protein
VIEISPTFEFDREGGNVIDSALQGQDTVRLDGYVVKQNSIALYFKANSPNPLVTGAPGIKYDLVVTLLIEGDKLTASVDGDVSKFPAHQVAISSKGRPDIIFGRNPYHHGNGPASLFFMTGFNFQHVSRRPPSGTVPRGRVTSHHDPKKNKIIYTK